LEERVRKSGRDIRTDEFARFSKQESSKVRSNMRENSSPQNDKGPKINQR